MVHLLRPVAAAASAAALAVAALPMSLAAANAYVATPLVSDQPGAPNRDSNLKNAWGVAFSPAGSPFWISDNGSGKSTLYDGTGAPFPPPPGSPVVVAIPCPPKHGEGSPCPTNAAPTGVVWNPTTSPMTAFLVPGTPLPAAFIWATEDGTLAAWNPGQADPSKAVLAANNAVKPTAKSGAVYKGLAFGVNESGTFLFATNFRSGTIDVFGPNQTSGGMGSSYKHASASGGFVDKGIPAGYAPFGIQNIDGNLIVTYAKQDAAHHDDVAGNGNGFVDAFDTDGHLLKRLASRGGLNSPWGVVRASYAFGSFGGDLLIGNFGNGWINALAPTGLVPLKQRNGSPLVIDGLWNLGLGGGKNSNPSTLYYTAGPNGETAGRFGTITPATPPYSTGPWTD
jgi:uncharacterized protein (TIGR03118 family)